MKLVQTIRILSLTAAMLLAASSPAQGPGGGGMRGGGGMHGGGGMGMPGGGGRMGMPGMPGRGGIGMPGGDPSRSQGGPRVSSGSARGGLAPTGRWWDDKKVAKSLGINGDQQKRMDGIFQQNRETLQQRYDAFTKAQSKLESLKRSGNVSETELFSEIERTSQARAELEQAYTHMQLQLRGEMTPDQIGALEEIH
ncbi:hypothetical protein Terro_0608 [Terriglobus roseus DSM 18391]|uniref:Heavy-metal resistance n=1 Tax=Terriglobus roseus (strain DSM 18391 / NRRL B-41598 / KBS 63) TaxID=926566 RepID=I3ZCH9_TERRK|nr:hypothetical protein [Terriglobus roseus]AFL86947.1 hypothetical protein Terro_0608 [Terriglobus roseus DSM 18391]